MQATYVARITLDDKKDLGRVEEILKTKSFSEPDLYAISTAPLVMLVSPYEDDFGREVRSFEITDHLVETGLLPKDSKNWGPVTKDMPYILLRKVEEQSPRVELYRVSATDLLPGKYIFFNTYPEFRGRGPDPFVPNCLEPDIRQVIYTDSSTHLFKGEYKY